LLVEGNRSAQERQEVSEPLLRDADLEVQHDTDGTTHTGEDRSIADDRVASLIAWHRELLPIELAEFKGVRTCSTRLQR
jgi:hypothetical protein